MLESKALPGFNPITRIRYQKLGGSDPPHVTIRNPLDDVARAPKGHRKLDRAVEIPSWPVHRTVIFCPLPVPRPTHLQDELKKKYKLVFLLFF